MSAVEHAILAWRPCGTIALAGEFINKISVSMGAVVGKAPHYQDRQTHMQKLSRAAHGAIGLSLSRIAFPFKKACGIQEISR